MIPNIKKIKAIPEKTLEKGFSIKNQEKVLDIVVKKRKTITRRIGRGESPSKRITYSALVRAKIDEPKVVNSSRDLLNTRKSWRKNTIQNNIVNSKEYAKEMFLFLYEHQLDDEKRYRTSLQKNYVGFNKVDAKRADTIIELMHKKKLTFEHEKFIQGMMYKYSGQIADLLNGVRRRPINMSERQANKGKKTVRCGDSSHIHTGPQNVRVKGKLFKPSEHYWNRIYNIEEHQLRHRILRYPHFAGEMLMYLYEQSLNPSNKEIMGNLSFGAKDRNLLKQYIKELRNVNQTIAAAGKAGVDNIYKTHIKQLTKIVAGYSNQVAQMLNAQRAENPSTPHIGARGMRESLFAEHGRTIYEPLLIRLLQKLSEKVVGPRITNG